MNADPPRDVVVARALKAHLHALLLLCALCVVLTCIGAAGLQLAGDAIADPRIRAGLSLLIAGQFLTILAAVAVGTGWLSIARTSDRAAEIPAARAQREVTARRLGLLARVTAAVAVAGITFWAIADISGLAGALVGAVLLLQVVLVALLLRSHLRRA